MTRSKFTRALAIAAVSAAAVGLAGCTDDDADVVSQNISKDADNFKIERRIVLVNGITDANLLEIVGRCNISDDGNQLEVVCAVGDGKYKKHFLHLSDNVTYVAEQVDGAAVSKSHYKVTFKPSVIIPDIDVR